MFSILVEMQSFASTCIELQKVSCLLLRRLLPTFLQVIGTSHVSDSRQRGRNEQEVGLSWLSLFYGVIFWTVVDWQMASFNVR